MASNMGFADAQGPLRDFGKQVSSMSSAVGGADGRSPTEIMQELADEVAAWMGVGGVIPTSGRVLPSVPGQGRVV